MEGGLEAGAARGGFSVQLGMQVHGWRLTNATRLQPLPGGPAMKDTWRGCSSSTDQIQHNGLRILSDNSSIYWDRLSIGGAM